MQLLSNSQNDTAYSDETFDEKQHKKVLSSKSLATGQIRLFSTIAYPLEKNVTVSQRKRIFKEKSGSLTLFDVLASMILLYIQCDRA